MKLKRLKDSNKKRTHNQTNNWNNIIKIINKQKKPMNKCNPKWK